jgi:hypothetical protein
VSSNNTESSSQLGMAKVTSTYEDVGISAIALEAQLREYERLNRAHIQQQQQSQSSRDLRGLRSIEGEGEQKVGASATGTSNSGNVTVGGEAVGRSLPYTATLKKTERNTRHVICSTCNKVLYIAPLVELFYCPRCRNVTSSR